MTCALLDAVALAPAQTPRAAQTATREAMLLIVFMTDHFMDLTCFRTNHAFSLRPDTAPEPAPGPGRNR